MGACQPCRDLCYCQKQTQVLQRNQKGRERNGEEDGNRKQKEMLNRVVGRAFLGTKNNTWRQCLSVYFSVYFRAECVKTTLYLVNY